MVAQRFEVYLVPLDPAHGHEMQKTRPCVVVSPNIANNDLKTVLVAPLTSIMRKYPFRVSCQFAGKKGQIAVDQIRCVDQSRLLKRLGVLDAKTVADLRTGLASFFR